MKARNQSAVAGHRERSSPVALVGAPHDSAASPVLEQSRPETAEAVAAAVDFDALLASGSIAALLLDRQKRIRRFTPAATALFNLLPADVGRPIRDLSPKFVDPTFLSDALLVLNGASVPKREMQSREGHCYVRETLPYTSLDGAIDGVVVTFVEVADNAVQEARLYAEAIVNSVREPLVVLDRDLRVHSVNVPFSELFRISGEDVVGQPLREVGQGTWDIALLLPRLTGVLESGEPMERFEFSFNSPALGLRALLLSARILHRGGNRPDLILMAVDDVTDRRRIEALLQENQEHRRQEEHIRQRQLELTNALRVSTVGELASGLAHELNQPLSSISNTVEACTRYVQSGTGDPDKLLELLADVATEAMRAAGIVAHLRSFIEKGEPQLEEADLKQIVSHVPNLLLRELDRTRVELHMDLPDRRLPIEADRIQIEQVIVNLLQNAMDSIREAERPQRRIELSARRVNGMAEVSVRDTGTGVCSSVSDRLFQPFFTTKSQGLGMGLALSRSILEAHRGRIWMEAPSDGGPGTVVRFSIPLKSSRRRRKEVPQ